MHTHPPRSLDALSEPRGLFSERPAEFPLVWQTAHWSSRVNCYASHVMQTLAENPPCDTINRSCIVCHLTHHGCICVSAIDRVNRSAWEEDRWRWQPPVRKRRLTLAKRLAAPARDTRLSPRCVHPAGPKQGKYLKTSEANTINPGRTRRRDAKCNVPTRKSLSKEFVLLLISGLCFYWQPIQC
jgi:hypothetical protein